jgi:hypothetical protein
MEVCIIDPVHEVGVEGGGLDRGGGISEVRGVGIGLLLMRKRFDECRVVDDRE